MLVNGRAKDTLSALDRGLHFGDGLFETFAVHKNKACLWRRHMERLCRGCERLGIPQPDTRLLRQEAQHEIGRSPNGVLKIILTRGTGGRGYQAPSPPRSCRIVAAFPRPEYPEGWYAQGIRVRLCTTRLGINPDLAGLKHLNRLEQVLARSEWNDPNIAEGLMLDAGGRVIEGTMTNLFLVKDDCLITPDLSDNGVAGVVRELVMDSAAKKGMTVRIENLFLSDILSADRAFLTNSVVGLWPVKRFEDHSFEGLPLPSSFREYLLAQVFSE